MFLSDVSLIELFCATLCLSAQIAFIQDVGHMSLKLNGSLMGHMSLKLNGSLLL